MGIPDERLEAIVDDCLTALDGAEFDGDIRSILLHDFRTVAREAEAEALKRAAEPPSIHDSPYGMQSKPAKLWWEGVAFMRNRIRALLPTEDQSNG